MSRIHSRILTVLAFAILLAWVGGPVLAHSGGTDSCGGHHDRKHGGYHVHDQAKYRACQSGKGAASTQPVPTPSATAMQSAATTADATVTVYVTRTGTKYHRA